MSRTPAAFLALALLAAAGEPGPANVHPTRDVSVLYEVEVAGEAGPRAVSRLRMSWLAAGNRLRIDPDGVGGWMLLEPGGGRSVMVLDARRAVVALPPAQATELTQDFPPGTAFARAGAAEFAGRPCTLWRVSIPGRGGRATCLTADGVMLSSDALRVAGRPARLRAVAVDAAPQDPARFRVPEGYRALAPPPGR